jgi:hypothetical protein
MQLILLVTAGNEFLKCNEMQIWIRVSERTR